MKKTDITGNGDFSLTIGNTTNSPEVTIYAPSTIGAATVAISYVDSTGMTIPYLDGSLAANEHKRVRCGTGVNLVATVTGFSTAFSLEYAS